MGHHSARQAAKKDLQGKRQQISSLMLRPGRAYPGKTTWGPAHMRYRSSASSHSRQAISCGELAGIPDPPRPGTPGGSRYSG